MCTLRGGLRCSLRMQVCHKAMECQMGPIKLPQVSDLFVSEVQQPGVAAAHSVWHPGCVMLASPQQRAGNWSLVCVYLLHSLCVCVYTSACAGWGCWCDTNHGCYRVCWLFDGNLVCGVPCLCRFAGGAGEVPGVPHGPTQSAAIIVCCCAAQPNAVQCPFWRVVLQLPSSESV